MYKYDSSFLKFMCLGCTRAGKKSSEWTYFKQIYSISQTVSNFMHNFLHYLGDKIVHNGTQWDTLYLDIILVQIESRSHTNLTNCNLEKIKWSLVDDLILHISALS